MKRIVTALSACALLASPSVARERGPRQFANPSAVVAAELAFARLAQEKGQWTAFRETATKDAVMFVPGPTNAQAWLRKQANPAAAVRWQPHEVWISCDGSAAVTRGAWQAGGGQAGGGQNATAAGYFITMWQRQKDGRYKWRLDQSEALAVPLPAPDGIAGHVASCSGRPVRLGAAYRPEVAGEIWGESDDGTLRWSTVTPPNGRFTVVSTWDGAALNRVIEQAAVNPPAPPQPR